MPEKSHVIIVIINTQGQIVQIHLIRKKSLTEMSHETVVWKIEATRRSAKQWYPQSLIGQAKFFEISAANQKKGDKCIVSPGISHFLAKRRVFFIWLRAFMRMNSVK